MARGMDVLRLRSGLWEREGEQSTAWLQLSSKPTYLLCKDTSNQPSLRSGHATWRLRALGQPLASLQLLGWLGVLPVRQPANLPCLPCLPCQPASIAHGPACLLRTAVLDRISSTRFAPEPAAGPQALRDSSPAGLRTGRPGSLAARQLDFGLAASRGPSRLPSGSRQAALVAWPPSCESGPKLRTPSLTAGAGACRPCQVRGGRWGLGDVWEWVGPPSVDTTPSPQTRDRHCADPIHAPGSNGPASARMSSRRRQGSPQVQPDKRSDADRRLPRKRGARGMPSRPDGDVFPEYPSALSQGARESPSRSDACMKRTVTAVQHVARQPLPWRAANFTRKAGTQGRLPSSASTRIGNRRGQASQKRDLTEKQDRSLGLGLCRLKGVVGNHDAWDTR